MSRIRRRITTGVATASAVLLWLPQSVMADNKPADMCSSINTSTEDYSEDQWMTLGLCHDTCNAGSYAFAIVQDHLCWCSNVAPGDNTILDDSKCDTQCPGYSEWCGGDKAFGYITLNRKPLSTNNGDSPQPTEQVQTVTANGTVQVQTVTITPTAGVNDANTSEVKTSSKKSNTGAIVGGVVGVAVLIMLLVGACVFWKIRKRKQAEKGFEVRNVASNGGVSAQSPEMSDAKGSSTFIAAGVVPDPSVKAGAGNRRSRLMPMDPRLDPGSAPPIYMRNKSADSIHTLRDDQDYSRRVHEPRVLRATNPDPDNDE